MCVNITVRREVSNARIDELKEFIHLLCMVRSGMLLVLLLQVCMCVRYFSHTHSLLGTYLEPRKYHTNTANHTFIHSLNSLPHVLCCVVWCGVVCVWVCGTERERLLYAAQLGWIETVEKAHKAGVLFNKLIVLLLKRRFEFFVVGWWQGHLFALLLVAPLLQGELFSKL